MQKKALFCIPKEWRNDEPAIPLRPTNYKVFGPSLYKAIARCYDWIEWAKNRFEEIWATVVDADVERAAAVRIEGEKLEQISKEHAAEILLVQNDLTTIKSNNDAAKAEMLREARAEVEKDEAKLEAAQAEFAQSKGYQKTYADLCRDI